jgi:hypothetical protein
MSIVTLLKPSGHDGQIAGLFLLPSWLSGLVAVLSGLGVAVASIIISRFQGSSLQQQLFDYSSARSVTDPSAAYQAVSHGLSSNAVVSDLPLLVFWGLVGLVVYLFATSIVGALQDAAELHNELEYVHAKPRQLLLSALLHLVFRVVILLLWLPYILVFFHRVVPYAIAMAHNGAADLISLHGLADSLLAFAVITVTVHIHVVLLRLVLLKPRVLSSALYLD